jgi:hypothetical protein
MNRKKKSMYNVLSYQENGWGEDKTEKRSESLEYNLKSKGWCQVW